MKPTTNTMSCREIFLWRIAAAIFWSFVLQAVFLIMFLFVMNFNPWHPILWIQQSAALSMSLGTSLYFCALGLVICAQGLVCCKDFFVVSKYCGTRFSFFCNMFSPHNMMMGTLYTVIGGFITWIYLSILGGKYGNLVAACSSDDKQSCLIEGYLFLILNGFWIGIYFFIHDYVFGTKALMFPVVQQLKFLQVKTELQQLLKRAMIDAISPTLYFVLIYYWNGQAIRDYARGFLGYDIEERSLETMFGLLNLSLLFYAWFFSTTFIFTIYTMKILFQLSVTEHIVFPITPVFGNSDSLTLHQGLTMTDIPVVQYLGFLDLKILAEKDRSRREELFTLSQPGGHPYNWNAVVEESLKLVRKFTEDLNKASTDTQPPQESKEHAVAEDYFLSKSSPIASTGIHSTSVSGMRNMSMRVENMSDMSLYQSPSIMAHFESPSDVSRFQPPPVSISQESIIRILKSYATQTLDVLCRKPGISYVFGELPGTKVRYHLAQGQPVIWAVQGLSRLAAASLKEDCYGVVQKDLPAIITSLLQLKQALDKLQKIGNYKRSHKVEHYDIRMKAALRSAVKRSLYCICITFGDYVKELPMKKDVLLQLQNFLLFREG